jgi:hypothetical protein
MPETFFSLMIVLPFQTILTRVRVSGAEICNAVSTHYGTADDSAKHPTQALCPYDAS